MIHALKNVAHPWHGISPGPACPHELVCFIEIVPTDTVKYEIDKLSGHLRVDRPQRYSNQCPALYGFIPQTYCGPRVAARAAERSGKSVPKGDGDPLDICVLSERPIVHGGCLVTAVPVGGLRMIDEGEADDKIIAVMKDDAAYGDVTDLSAVPAALVERLRHYFLTYKTIPGSAVRKVEIAEVYGAEEARKVIMLTREDYRAEFES